MVDIRVVVQENRLPQLSQIVEGQVERRVETLAQLGRGYAVLSIVTASPGTPQTRYSPRRTVTAANPGETPNADTNNLGNSISVQPAGRLQRAIAVGAEYGLPLEVGTPDMPARPFMAPMALWLEEQVDDVFAGLVD